MDGYKKFAAVTISTLLLLFILFVVFTHMMKNKLEDDNAITFSSTSSENNIKKPDALELNTADFEEISRVQGVGRKLAHNIIDYREAIGGFTTVRQLRNVVGIDEQTYELIKNKFYVESEWTRFEEETSSENVTKININTATVRELMTLPSITETLAREIVTYREENEDFVNVDEIMQVEGIGEGIFSLISRYITV